jgi:hypothetical protein
MPITKMAAPAVNAGRPIRRTRRVSRAGVTVAANGSPPQSQQGELSASADISRLPQCGQLISRCAIALALTMAEMLGLRSLVNQVHASGRE